MVISKPMATKTLRNGSTFSSEYGRTSYDFIIKFTFSDFSFVFVEIRSRYDLYSKGETVPDIEQLWPYYQSLIDKYLPGKLEF